MEKHCQNPLCGNEAVKQVPVSVRKASDQKRSLCAACEEVYTWGVQQGQMSKAGLQIEPPPREKGPQPLYRVVYVIDVNAANPGQAAGVAYELMKDPGSMRPVLHVLDGEGCEAVVDLAAESSGFQAGSQSTGSREKARRFVLAGGSRCPCCDGEDIDFGRVDVDDQCAYQEACCCNCQARFSAIYRLVGYGLRVNDSLEVHTMAEDSGRTQGAGQ